MSAIDLSQLSEEETYPAVPPTAVPPFTIILNDGDVFKSDETDNFQFHPKGIFATGYWIVGSVRQHEDEKDILFFDNAIKLMTFDFSKVVIPGGEGASS